MKRMKAAVIYYSFEGNSEAAAKKAAELTGAALFRISADHEPPKTKMKYLVGGKQALSGFRPKIRVPSVDYSQYDTIILACPVWAGTMAPAMRSYLGRHPFSEKKVYLIVCSASGNGQKTLRNMAELLEGNMISGEYSLKNPLTHQEELEKLNALNG